MIEGFVPDGLVTDGVLVVDKPPGWTSHQVVGRLRRIHATRKVGHAGTLDPMATGALVVGFNRATRLLGHLALHDKVYNATIRMGQATTTDDAEGELTSTADASQVTDAMIVEGIEPLTGAIEQVPSSVSAIKVDGQRAYARVRAGEDVQLKAREVTVSRFDVVSVRRDGGTGVIDVDVEVECSSGTYIRALARDLGASLGVGGHLTSLRRTRVGPFVLPEVPVDLESIKASRLMSMADAARLSFSCVDVDDEIASRVRSGRPIAVRCTGTTGVIASSGHLLALYQPGRDPGWAVPVAVLAEAP